jgi:hypothetical protein
MVITLKCVGASVIVVYMYEYGAVYLWCYMIMVLYH